MTAPVELKVGDRVRILGTPMGTFVTGGIYKIALGDDGETLYYVDTGSALSFGHWRNQLRKLPAKPRRGEW